MEISLHALCDGTTASLFPASQDHKRALDGDLGLNTGGMGAYSPTPFLSAAQFSAVSDTILTPWLRGCEAEGIDFRGILYPGVMLTSAGPKVLEFNARFGDPESQGYLPRLDSAIVTVLDASGPGDLCNAELCATTRAKHLQRSRHAAYLVVERIQFDGAQYGTDIAAKGLS